MGKTFEKRLSEQLVKDEKAILPSEDRGVSLPNSTIMRIMQNPGAEDEADRLSAGISSATPASVKQEMGGRLNADLSGVRFHNDTASAVQSHAMGAKAWAQGRDVYFGRGGFDPSVAAHELVHTVQQGAVCGNASVSMPYGAVQLDPEDEEDGKAIKKTICSRMKTRRRTREWPMPKRSAALTNP